MLSSRSEGESGSRSRADRIEVGSGPDIMGWNEKVQNPNVCVDPHPDVSTVLDYEIAVGSHTP